MGETRVACTINQANFLQHEPTVRTAPVSAMPAAAAAPLPASVPPATSAAAVPREACHARPALGPDQICVSPGLNIIVFIRLDGVLVYRTAQERGLQGILCVSVHTILHL